MPTRVSSVAVVRNRVSGRRRCLVIAYRLTFVNRIYSTTNTILCSYCEGYCVVRDTVVTAPDAAHPELPGDVATGQPECPRIPGLWTLVPAPKLSIRSGETDKAEDQGGSVWVFAFVHGCGAGNVGC